MNSPEFDDPTEGLSRFFDYFWGAQEGLAYLPVKEGNSWKKFAFPWPHNKSDIIKHVLANSAEGKDVYFGPALYKSTAVKDKTLGQKEGIKGSYVHWTDYDGNAPKYSTSYPSSDEDDAPRCADGPLQGHPAPTLRVRSSQSGHEHHYWKLTEWCDNSEVIEERNKALTYISKADTGGWDATQVLRPIHSSNWKHQENPKPVTIEFYTETEIKPTAFESLPSFQTVVRTTDASEFEELPEVERIIAKYKWDDKHFDLFVDKQIPEGQRSSALMRIGFFGAEMGMTDKEIYALLVNADSRWGKFKYRNDRHQRLLDIVNKARLKHPYAKDSLEAIGQGLLQAAPTEEPEKWLYGFKDFLHTERKVEWAVEGLIEKGGFTMVTGKSGVGKTGWTLQFNIHMALGKDFLGWKVERPLKLLFLSLEMQHEALLLFGETIAKNYAPEEIETLQRNFIISPLGRPIPFDREEGKKIIESLIQEVKPDGVIIDSLGKTSVGELTEGKVKELNSYFNYLRREFGCFIQFIHHNRKGTVDNKRPKDLDDLYGSQYIAAEATSVVCLFREKDERDEIEVLVLKSRLAREPEPFKIIRSDTLSFKLAKAEVGQGLLQEKEPEPEKDAPTNGRGIFEL